jgi:molybdenum cofactor cytidylyltransferase
MSTPRRIGVILAAGRGRRMGGTKQLASWTTADVAKPLVAAAFDAIRPICDEMVVVVGHEADAVAAALCGRQFETACGDPDAPMFESIRAGIGAARGIDPAAMVVLQPGDHPQVAASTLDALTNASHQRPVHAIIPQYGSSGGHPVLIPPEVAAIVLQAECPAGLGEFWIEHPELCHRVPVDDRGVVRDVDTLGDLCEL